MRKINKIILHCSATPEGKNFKAKDIKAWHISRGWSDIGYHFIIDLDGTIEPGRDINKIGSHCLGQNKDSIGICYIGGCDANMKAKDTRTEAQKSALIDLVYDIMQQYHLTLNQVYCHNQFNPGKECPSYNINTFKKEFRESGLI